MTLNQKSLFIKNLHYCGVMECCELEELRFTTLQKKVENSFNRTTIAIRVTSLQILRVRGASPALPPGGSHRTGAVKELLHENHFLRERQIVRGKPVEVHAAGKMSGVELNLMVASRLDAGEECRDLHTEHIEYP